MDYKRKNILSTNQFDKRSMEVLFSKALKMEKVLKAQKRGGRIGKILDGKVLATLFFEPSTRTRFSFETAFLRLGGRVISGADMMLTSSIKKKETLQDTGKVTSQYADLIVMRHPDAGSVIELADGAYVPVINAGDGPNQHPTQGLLDVYTMWKAWNGKVAGKTVGMIGDLKNGRVPHSQCDLLKHWGVKFIFVSPKALKMPMAIEKYLRSERCEVRSVVKLGGVIGEMDAICATRIQEERFKSKKEAAKYAKAYVIDPVMMKKAKKGALLMHPLPRVEEITASVDRDPRARYFEQVHNGLALRMALMALILKR
jgi:aspartate carbamoyltransferase catalytic subunit